LADDDTLKFGHAAACLKHSFPGDYFRLRQDAVRAAMTASSLDVKR
jgi:2-dehydro-3-deoxygluconokinase